MVGVVFLIQGVLDGFEKICITDPPLLLFFTVLYGED